MSTLQQCHDPAALLEQIQESLFGVHHALEVGALSLARGYADAGLADISTYRMCRDEGLEEPLCSLGSFAQITLGACYSSADSFVDDVEGNLRGITEITEEDFQP